METFPILTCRSICRCEQKYKEAQKESRRKKFLNSKQTKRTLLHRSRSTIFRITICTFALHRRGLATTFCTYWNRKFWTLARSCRGRKRSQATRSFPLPQLPAGYKALISGHLPEGLPVYRHQLGSRTLLLQMGMGQSSLSSLFSTWHHFSQIFFQIAHSFTIHRGVLANCNEESLFFLKKSGNILKQKNRENLN